MESENTKKLSGKGPEYVINKNGKFHCTMFTY